ncbi:MAG: c-type cytochrome domain-containing protein, partial [Planctomycetota bacterium]
MQWFIAKCWLRTPLALAFACLVLDVYATSAHGETGSGDHADAESISFLKQIRPVLADKCFACHGPDDSSREGGFRFDKRESATSEADSGEHPIVPGDPDSSEM